MLIVRSVHKLHREVVGRSSCQSRVPYSSPIHFIINPIMMSLLPFSLPLQDQPPVGYGWEGRDFSVLSTTPEAIEQRDRFLGHMCCVVCGMASESLLKLCHIVGQEIVCRKRN